ncbi:MAG: aminoacyl-tRNA hydrolase [Candidatus Ancaeobacter aquaticus]|nr:aminoacyl-tRNA hydrolase [Candidatus Ancaeobacter aquaticus]
MKIIFGLGNPGLRYKKTRHNIGFRILDEVASSHRAKFTKDRKRQAYIAKIHSGGQTVILVKPLSYMNLSGDVVSKCLAFFDVDITDSIVVVDDIHLKTGSIRVRERGGSGGHNGLASIQKSLSTNHYVRVRYGVKNESVYPLNVPDYVLGKFTKDEERINLNRIKDAAEALETILSQGLLPAMDRYNQKQQAG